MNEETIQNLSRKELNSLKAIVKYGKSLLNSMGEMDSSGYQFVSSIAKLHNLDLDEFKEKIQTIQLKASYILEQHAKYQQSRP